LKTTNGFVISVMYDKYFQATKSGEKKINPYFIVVYKFWDVLINVGSSSYALS